MIAQAPLGNGRRHELHGELIVSLTSYPPRFSSLHLTLTSLLQQGVRPDRLVLWIAHEHSKQLPIDVQELERYGLEIRVCEDLRSFKKMVPALEAFPDAYIVTADDDIYFPPDWLEGLLKAFDSESPAIVCYRAVRPVRSADGRLAPFLEWELRVSDERARLPCTDIMAETGAGALFPPNSLHKIVTSRSTFERVCPDADDLWFFWCARMAGTLYKKVGATNRLVTWPGSQSVSLWQQNKTGGNDRAIRALEEEFGPLP